MFDRYHCNHIIRAAMAVNGAARQTRATRASNSSDSTSSASHESSSGSSVQIVNEHPKEDDEFGNPGPVPSDGEDDLAEPNLMGTLKYPTYGTSLQWGYISVPRMINTEDTT